MKRLIRRFVARLALVAALVPCVPALGATVDAATYWNGDLSDGSTKDRLTMSAGTGCTFAGGRATTTASTSTAYTGLMVDLSADSNAASNITVLVKYSGFEQGSAQNNAILGILLGENNELLLGYRESDGLKIFSGVTSTGSGSQKGSAYKYAEGLPTEGALMVTVVGTATTYKGVFIYLAQKNEDGTYKPFNLLTYWHTTGTEFTDATKFLGIKVGGSISKINSYHRPKMVIEGLAVNYGLSDRIMFPNEAWFPAATGYVKKTAEQLFLANMSLSVFSNALFTAHANGASMDIKDAVASGYLPTYTVSGGVLTSMTRRFCAADDAYVKSVLVTFTQKGNDIYYKAESAGYANGRTTDPTTVETWIDRSVAESAAAQQYGMHDIVATVPYTQVADVSGSRNWSAIAWKKGVDRSVSASKPTADTDVTGLVLVGATTLTMNEAVTTGLFKVMSDTVLTFKYASAPTRLSARILDFSDALGKVRFDCSSLSVSGTTVLMSGTILGTANIDVSGSRLPSGASLVVTDSEIKLVVAQWTRGAGTDDITDANNWKGGYVPYRSGVFTDDFSLAADADWSSVTISGMNAKAINLNGHRLTLSSLAGTGMITDSSTDPTAPGEFVALVASGKTWQNTGVALSGNLKFVKEGAGTFDGKVKNQSYTGGTLVSAGRIRSASSESDCYYGPRASTVTVDPNGTLEINGQYGWNVHQIILNGGVLSNKGSSQTTYANGIGDVTLTADSRMELTKSTVFCKDYATLNLNGHTLTVSRTSGTSAFLCSFGGDAETHYTITGGTLVTGVGIRLNLRKEGVDASGASFVVNGTWLHKAATTPVIDLEENLTGRESESDDKSVVVSRRFKTNGKFDEVRLSGDGVILDLSGNTGTFSTTSLITARAMSLSFDENSLVTVDLTGRKDLADGMKVVSWKDATKPPESVTFKGVGLFGSLVRKADGLYVDRGIITIFR